MPVLNVDEIVQIDSAGVEHQHTVSVLNVSGRLDGSRTISVTNQFDWSNTMAGSGHTVVLPSAVFNIDIQHQFDVVVLQAPRVLDNYSDVNWNNPTNTGTGISNGGTFINEAGASFSLPSSFIQEPGPKPYQPGQHHEAGRRLKHLAGHRRNYLIKWPCGRAGRAAEAQRQRHQHIDARRHP